MIINRIKLAKMLLKLASIATDKAELIYEGELAEGIEVFIESDGDIVPAPDDEYVTESVKIVVKDGKVETIEEIKVEEEPKEEEPVEPIAAEEEPKEEEPIEPEKDEKDLRIEELEGLLADRDATIEELTNKIKELEETNKVQEEKLSAVVDKPAFKEIKEVPSVVDGPKSKALKYFK